MPSRKIAIIHDGTPAAELSHGGRGTGLDLSGRPAGFAYAGTAEPFPDSMLVPRPEWQARIAEMEGRKSRLSDLVDQAGLPCKDQQQTNYCWGNAPTHCTEIDRVLQNEPRVILSPASACGPITGYRNVGGWGKTALEWIAAHGLVPVDKWPANAIDRRYATPENLELAKGYRVLRWYELEPGNLDHLISALLHRIPVAIGLSWWGHEVTAYDPVWLDGTAAVRFRNSWGMGYGDRGYGILQGRRMLPDDAVAPWSAVAA